MKQDALWKKLFLYSVKLSRDPEMAMDLASEALLKCLEASACEPNAMKWPYASSVVHNEWMQALRFQKTREVNLPNRPDNEIAELVRLSEAPTQEIYALAVSVVAAFSQLPDQSRVVMTKTALGFTPEEIIADLGMPKWEVYWRLRESRKFLRSNGYWDDERATKNHSTFCGIRKRHRKWVAEIRVDNKYSFIGSYATASDAAKAYDEAAKEHFGCKAKLNFPEAA